MDANKRLDSWKAIAAYLKRDESTVRRWEKEGLPVHRHLHTKKASVYAFPTEIDAWWNKDRLRLEGEKAPAGSRRRLAWLIAICSIALVAGTGWLALGNRSIERPAGNAITSIAVLPLENLSGDPQQDYFADGITEALISELGRITTLRVMSRSSVMSYKGGKKPFDQVARELNVDALVEGAVVREGSRVRVTARLVGMRPERALWSERYEREFSSMLMLQADLARAIAGEVQAKLTSPHLLLSKRRAVDPEAYDAYLKGRFQFNKATADGIQQARASFEEAIRRDPSFAPAYAGLADTYSWSWSFPGRTLQPPHAVFPKANAAVLKALELDETLAEAHLSLGLIKERYEWDWDGAGRAYRRAIELNPSYATAHHWYAMYLGIPKRYEEAFAHLRRAEELDPLSLRVKAGKGWLYLWSGQFDRMLQHAQMMLELEPNHGQVHYFLGHAYLANGMYEEAVASYRREIERSGKATRLLAFSAHALGKAGRKTEALQLIAELTERARHDYVAGNQLAIAHIGVGNKEEALRWLEHAFQQRTQLGDLNRGAHFWLHPLHSDPRYQDLIRRVGLPNWSPTRP